MMQALRRLSVMQALRRLSVMQELERLTRLRIIEERLEEEEEPGAARGGRGDREREQAEMVVDGGGVRLPSRSAMVRATRRTRSMARADSANRSTARPWALLGGDDQNVRGASAGDRPGIDRDRAASLESAPPHDAAAGRAELEADDARAEIGSHAEPPLYRSCRGCLVRNQG